MSVLRPKTDVRRGACTAAAVLLVSGVWAMPAQARSPASQPKRPVCAVAPSGGHEAVTSAIAACPDGSTVRFPPRRTYRLTGSIVVPGRTALTIDGNGSRFVRTSPNADGQREPNWVLEEGRGIVLRNMTILGSFRDRGPRRIIPGNQFNHGVAVRGGRRITLRDLTIRDVFGDLVTVEPPGHDARNPVPRNVRVQRLTGSRAARQCVAVTGAVGFWLQTSRLSNCYQLAVDIEQDVPGELLRDIHILRNTIRGFYLTGIGVAGPSDSPPRLGDISGIEVRGNTVATPSDTCWPAVGTERGPISKMVTTGNTLRTIGDGVRYATRTTGAVRGNRIVNRAGPRFCASPAMPVRILRSALVTVTRNRAAGY